MTLELPSGETIGSDADLSAYSDGTTRFDELKEVYRLTREHNGCASITSFIDVIAVQTGHPLRGRFSYCRRWAILDDRWLLISVSVDVG
ncbi:hypothetical protein DO944_13490 [Microbacterium sp. SMR1]|nr:hypothetical protein DO944_13490 [Microbacterium sp. SMR1]